MRKKQVTILELATRLDLSASTVSRALNGKHRISDETRKRVQKLASELGYRPNVSARHLRENRTYMLGVMVPSLEPPFVSQLLEAMVLHARQQSHHIILQVGGNLETLQFLLGNHIDGVFLVAGKGLEPDALIEAVRQRFLPVVMIGPESVPASRIWWAEPNEKPVSDKTVTGLVTSAFDLLFEEMEQIEEDIPLAFQQILC